MFAVRIKNLRLTKGLNQVQLADKLGVKKQSISNWENDNIQPSIEMLKKSCPYCKIMVGGAVLTEEYAKEIGADRYCKDAAASARYANAVFLPQ